MYKLKTRLSKSLLLATTSLILLYLLSYGLSENYSQTYQLLNEPNGSTYYRLTVTVQQSLYDYYIGKSHTLGSINDFAKFVTPYALKPIADSFSEIYMDDEDFANGVLMFVHQIPYNLTGPAKYPVETIVENKGDCDLFSYVAASIMKAGGFDVVLLYYENEAHMNVGVSLSHEPYDVRSQVYNVTYNNIKYYVAECTGEEWKNGWRVGECPPELRQALNDVQVITLEDSEQWAPGQVSSSYETLSPSTLSLTISPTYLIQGGTVTLSGQLSPALQNQTITIYVKMNNEPWTVLCMLTTDWDGRFTYAWNVETAGICYVRASWSGYGDYAGADSITQSVTVLSLFFIVLLVVTVILVCFGIVVFFLSRKAQQEIQEPQPLAVSP